MAVDGPNGQAQFLISEKMLCPDGVSEGFGIVAGELLNDRTFGGVGFEVSAMELGVGSAPFLVSLRHATSRLVALSLHGVDTQPKAVSYARFNVFESIAAYGSPTDRCDMRTRSWDEVVDDRERYDVVYFNPPYRRDANEVRGLFRNQPSAAMFVPDGESPTYYYEQVLPRLMRIINPEGLCFIRTPREPFWRNAVTRLVQQAIPEGHTLHSAVVHVDSPTEKRIGRGLLVEAAEALEMRYTVVSDPRRGRVVRRRPLHE